jgi:two-component system, NtrC family, response regulator AtoC
VRFVMPPLRQRAGDIPALIAHFIKIFSDENGVPPLEVEPGAMKTLQAYAWPGNIRELRNFCENAVVLHKGGKLSEYDLDPRFRGSPSSAPSAAGSAEAGSAPTLSVEQNEKRILREALIKSRGNRTKAAELMGISRRTLHRKLAQWPELDVHDR